MNIDYNGFLISDDQKLIQPDRAYELLSDTYWADSRSRESVEKSIQNSLCFGIYKDGLLIGFARCVTDYAVMYWLGDVIIDGKYRGLGLGKALIKVVTEHEKLANLIGFLGTRDAHGLYEQFGFQRDQGSSMRKGPNTEK